MKTFYENKDVLIIEKPVGIPCESASGEECVTDILKKEKNTEIFLLHRLDRNVGGVMMFAKNKKSAAFLQNEMQNGVFKKEYLAVTDGIPEQKSGVYEDLLFKDSRKNRSFVVKSMRKGVKKALLEFEVIGEKNGKALVKVLLHTGRTHQIRVQFSSRKTPLCGDGKYGSHDNASKNIALNATYLTVKIPGGEVLRFASFPDTSVYPWNLFEEQIGALDE